MSSDNNTTTNNDNKQNAGTMTTQDASRIQSAEAKSGTGGNLADTFAARAQSAAAKNENEQDKGKGKDTKGCCINNPEHAIVDSPSDEADKSRGPTKVCDAQ
ncbi:pyrophosphatase/phosphodiesterase [Apiospora arundinis]